MLDADTLAGVLVQISFFPGMSQAMRDAVRVVAILLWKAVKKSHPDKGGTEVWMATINESYHHKKHQSSQSGLLVRNLLNT